MLKYFYGYHVTAKTSMQPDFTLRDNSIADWVCYIKNIVCPLFMWYFCFQVPAVEDSNISGYLKTRVGKKWQRKWYVVKDHVLYASKASSVS